MSAGPGRRLHGPGSWRRRATGRRAGDPAGAGPVCRPAATTGAGTAATLAALTVTLGPAAACWVVAVWQVNGTDMGVATRAGPVFIGSYLAVWATAGMAVYAVDRLHGSVAARVTLIVAGSYEITPLKRQFRRRCRASAGSGFGYGLCCAGSSIGLTATLVALGVISIPWMALITIVVLAQKLLPARAAIDVPLALAIIGLGILIILAPSSVPGLTPPM
jgi:predicted metal-binding membrane protein